MNRKDCEVSSDHALRRWSRGAPSWLSRAAWVAAGALFAAHPALAGAVRVWPAAVVVGDVVRLDDVCELRGFDADIERTLAGLALGEAPRPGGSRILHISLMREAISAGGANLAELTLGGATECVVTRPSTPCVVQPTPPAPSLHHESAARARPAAAEAATGERAVTLRQAVVAYFNDELHRFGGRAELVFDRTSEQVLDLSGPTYSFKVRRRGGPPLGLVPLEVDVRTDGRAVQTVPLVVQVSMVRPVVTAARAINQEATVGSADVRVVPLAFNRTDKLGVSDPGQIVGQRARRFIPAGSILEPGLLESVPLVVRGQLVTLITQVGPVRVVTSGKAADTGTFGDVVRVRSVDDRRTEFNGVVVGPAKVEVGVHRGTYSEAQADPQLAMTRGVPR